MGNEHIYQVNLDSSVLINQEGPDFHSGLFYMDEKGLRRGMSYIHDREGLYV